MMASVVPKFRDCFKIPSKTVLQWYPGHMNKGIKQMQQKLKLVDCIIEVHDARIPISGRNPNFRRTVSGLKPHILVLNKVDLADTQYKDKVENKLKQEGISKVIYTNCKDHMCKGVKKIVPTVTDLILNSDRRNRSEERDYCLMIIGVPNVGKSSLINALRNRHLHKKGAAHVGAVAGITRSVLNRIKIREEPPIYLIDTPGILTPNVVDVDSALRLSVCASLQDHIVGEVIIADYLLYWMNKNKHFTYVKHLQLEGPCDSIVFVLTKIATNLGKSLTKKFDGQFVVKPDFVTAAQHFIKTFRSGALGTFLLDIDQL